MPRDCVKTDAASKSAFYSQAVRAAGLIFVSGQAAVDPTIALFDAIATLD